MVAYKGDGLSCSKAGAMAYVDQIDLQFFGRICTIPFHRDYGTLLCKTETCVTLKCPRHNNY